MRKSALINCFLLLFIPFSVLSQHALISARGTMRNPGAAAAVFTGKTSVIEAQYTHYTSEKRNVVSCQYSEYYSFAGIPQLKWSMGAGLHGGSKRIMIIPGHFRMGGDAPPVPVPSRKLFGGANMKFGLHYFMKDAPVFAGLDLKPYVNFINEESAFWDWGISIGLYF